MNVRGPESFYSIQLPDEFAFLPVDDLPEVAGLSTFDCLAFELGRRVVGFTVARGYGIFIEHEDSWVFGRTVEEVGAVASEWPRDQDAAGPKTESRRG